MSYVWFEKIQNELPCSRAARYLFVILACPESFCLKEGRSDSPRRLAPRFPTPESFRDCGNDKQKKDFNPDAEHRGIPWLKLIFFYSLPITNNMRRGYRQRYAGTEKGKTWHRILRNWDPAIRQARALLLRRRQRQRCWWEQKCRPFDKLRVTMSWWACRTIRVTMSKKLKYHFQMAAEWILKFITLNS